MNTERTLEHGFTLVEVLIAMAVTSMFLVLLLPVSVSSLRRAEFSAHKNRAWLLVQSQLAGVAVCRGPASGLITGAEAPLSWELRVGDGDKQARNPANSGSAVSLRTARVTVRDIGAGPPLVDMSVQRVCTEP